MQINGSILVTGASGFIGNQLIQLLQDQYPDIELIGTDIKKPDTQTTSPNYTFLTCDIRDGANLKKIINENKVSAIVHLASVVTPPPGMARETLYDIDVNGTHHLLEAAVEHNVEHFIVTSSGAAYGYHRDNADWLKEDDPLRGDQSFSYAYHKREIECLLALYQKKHPQLKQLILRPGTVLGKTVNNQITDLFKKPVLMGIFGHKSPFVFIWDQDLVKIIAKGLEEKIQGIFNVAGDGAISTRDIASLLGKPYLPIPAFLVKAILAVFKPLNLSQYGPEQVKFLMYRPVLLNSKLKEVFGYIPSYTSKEAFIAWMEAQNNNQRVST